MRDRVKESVMIRPGSEGDEFVDALRRMAAHAGLGIAPNCLTMTTRLIEQVVQKHRSAMADLSQRELGMKSFEDFVGRMIQAARVKGYEELHEDTFMEARNRCGLLWWCE